MSPENRTSEKGNASHLPTINFLGDVRFREGKLVMIWIPKHPLFESGIVTLVISVLPFGDPKSTGTCHELKLGSHFLLDLVFGGLEFIEREPNCDSR